jgi:hypothetical protein
MRVRAVTAKRGTTCERREGDWRKKHERARKSGAPGRRERLHRARETSRTRAYNECGRETEREGERSSHELRMHTHPRACTRSKYGRLSFLRDECVRSFVICVRVRVRDTMPYSLSPPIFVSLSFSSCVRARALLASASGRVKHLLSSLLSPRS